jgi:hypothetical protein
MSKVVILVPVVPVEDVHTPPGSVTVLKGATLSPSSNILTKIFRLEEALTVETP